MGRHRRYDRRRFADHGIKHVDLYFLDGSCPDKEAFAARFLAAVELDHLQIPEHRGERAHGGSRALQGGSGPHREPHRPLRRALMMKRSI